MSEQGQDTTFYEHTVILPDYPTQKMSKQKKPKQEKPKSEEENHTSTSVHLDIFRDEEIAEEPLDLEADGSLDFRQMLEQSGKKYKIEKLLATGGFGQIFLARDQVLGRKVVIKSLKQEYLHNEPAVKQFISEAKLSSQLNHPSIVPIYSLDTDKADGLHIAMQLIQGITLKVYLQRTLAYFQGKKPSHRAWDQALKERLALFIRVCDAIAYCHDRSIIHNDLKPGNIMIADFGQVYVMDWGIAAMAGSISNRSAQGTVSYMAPERITSRISDEKTDIFSLGMILNEVVTLRDPVSGENLQKTIEKICTGDVEPSTSRLHSYPIPRPLRAIIEKARNPKPAARYDSVKELANDIRHFLFFEEVKAAPDSFPMRLVRFLFRNKKFAVLLLIAVLLSAFCSIFYSYYRRTQLVRAMQTAMLQQQYIQSETDRRAEEVGQNLRLMEEQIRCIASTLKYQLESPADVTKAIPAHTAEDFAPRNPHRISGLVHTGYYKNPLTLKYGVFHTFGSPVPPDELQKMAVSFQGIHHLMLASMFMNTVTDRNSIRNDENKLFHLRESLIRQMIFLFGDKLAYCYPGMYSSHKSPLDFLPNDVQREFRKGNRSCWSSLYLDQSGVPVVACWQLLYDTHGKEIGKIGHEVNFQQLLKPLLSFVEEEDPRCVTMLVDQDDRSIFSSYARFKHRTNNFMEHVVELANTPTSYHYPQILQKIQQKNAPSNFPITASGKKYRVYWSKLPCTNWLLIRHVPEK